MLNKKMSKRNIIIIALGLIVVLFLAIFFFFGRGGKQVDTEDIDRDLFTFEEADSRDLGSSITDTDDIENGLLAELDNISPTNIPRLRKISFKETSGFGLFRDNGTTTIRYVDRQTGNIFETNSKISSSKRITNTTILRTINSLWIDKDNVVLRYISEEGDIKTFSANINTAEEIENQVSNLVGSFSDNGIDQIDTFENRLLMLKTNNFGSNLSISDLNFDKETIVYSTPLREILVSFINNKVIAINTKPSALSKGYLFLVNPQNGVLEDVLSTIVGLYSIVSEDGKGILYSSSRSKGISLWFLDRDSGNIQSIQKSTLADKCDWANSEGVIVYCAVPKNISFRNLPDEWYQGNISFNDEIWKINLETGETELIVDLEKTSGEIIDVLRLSVKEDYIVLINKLDMTLWGIDLSKN